MRSASHIKTIKLGECYFYLGDFSDFLRNKSNTKPLPNLREIYFPPSVNLEIQYAVSLVRQASKLEKLEFFCAKRLILSKEKELTEDQLRLLIEGARELTVLEVHCSTYFFAYLESKSAAIDSVEDLRMTMQEITVARLDLIFKKFPNIQSLTFIGGEYSLIQLKEVLARGTHLTKLSIKLLPGDGQFFPQAIISILKEYPELKELQLSCEGMSSTQVIQIVEEVGHIEKFHHVCEYLDFSKVSCSKGVLKTLLLGAQNFYVLKLKSATDFFSLLNEINIRLDTLIEIDFGDSRISVEEIRQLSKTAYYIRSIKCKNEILDFRGEGFGVHYEYVLLKNTSHVREIYCNENRNLDMFKLILVRSDLSNCEKISVKNESFTADELVSLLRRGAKLKEINHSCHLLNLNEVTTSLTYSEFRMLAVGNHAELVNINLTGLYGVGRPFFCDFGRLEEFELDQCRLTGVVLSSLLSHSPNLCHLGLSASIVDPEENTFSHGSLKKLLSLKVTIPNVPKLYLDALFLGAPAIERLAVHYLPEYAAYLPEYQYFNQIKSLKISGFVGDDRNKLLLAKAINITRLVLSEVEITGPAPILDTPLECLEILWLTGFRLTDTMLLKIVRNCPKLQCIVTSRMNFVKDNSSEELAKYREEHSISIASHDAEDMTSSVPKRDAPVSQRRKQNATSPDSTVMGDADTEFKEKTYDLHRIFYEVSSLGSHPELSDYRLVTRNRIVLNTERCTKSSAFTLGNDGELGLSPCSSLRFMESDVYQAVVSRQKETLAKCYYAKVTLLLSDQWQALPSLYANEKITKIHIDPQGTVEVQYSERDNLYYIRREDSAPASVTIDYLVESEPVKASPSADITCLLAFFKGKFKSGKLAMPSDHATGTEYLLALATQQVGSCRHRAFVFLALIKYPELLDSIPELSTLNLTGVQARFIQNGFHAYVEVKEIYGWVKYDLDGYPAQVNINGDADPLLQAANLEKLEELTTGGEHGPGEVTSLLAAAKNIKRFAFDISQPLKVLMSASHLEELTMLDLGERELSIAELKALLRKFPNLQELVFKQCVFSHNGIVSFKDALPATHAVIPLPALPAYFPTPTKQEVVDASSYAKDLVRKDESKRLIECSPEQLSGLCYELQYYCQHTQQPYHTVHSADQLVLRCSYLEMQDSARGSSSASSANSDTDSSDNSDDKTGFITEGLHGPVYRFLSGDATSRTLIVDFSQFSASEVARFNSLLDDEPNIDGVPLPSGTKVIGLINPEEYRDASLYSRFGQAVETCTVEASKLSAPFPFDSAEANATTSTVLSIDFYNEDSWEEKLLGSWRIKGDKLFFRPGALVMQLESGEALEQIILRNPPLANPEFSRFFQQANLRGYIEYQGRRVDWPSPKLIISNELVFAPGQIVDVVRSVPPVGATLINPSVFPRFLKKYELVEDEQRIKKLFERKGFLRNHPKGEPLTIYVAENLTLGQWSQLLAECKNLKIPLHIVLGNEVSLPLPISADVVVPVAITTVHYVAFDSERLLLGDGCIASDDIDLTLASWQLRQPEAMSIDVSELFSSDLLTKLTGDFNDQRQALDFSEEGGALLQLLSEKKTVILTGKLSVEMRQWLQDFLYKRKGQSTRDGQVVIITDEATVRRFENITPISRHHVTLLEKKAQLECYQQSVLAEHELGEVNLDQIDSEEPYVNQQAKLRHKLSRASVVDPWAGLKYDLPVYTSEMAFDLSTAEQQSNEVDQRRLSGVNKTLQVSRFVFLSGITGTGKTSFVEDVWQSAQHHRKLFVGLDQLDSWAQDSSDNTKVIFIDEANITRDNWTRFEDLFRNQPPGMVVGNKYVTLSSNHKVIFAGNPVSYSDDRTLPSLFDRHGNSVVFDPLPPAYIYQRMLLPLFGSDIELAEKICTPILSLNQYLNGLVRNTILLTPRELIMMTQLTIEYSKEYPQVDVMQIAKYFCFELSQQFVPLDHLATFKAKFSVERPMPSSVELPSDCDITLTNSNRLPAQMLTDFLRLRQVHINSGSKLPVPGLGGVTMEGEPGLGKTNLSIACLRAQGLTLRSLDAEGPLGHKNYFYHLPAGANINMKEKILKRAFSEGLVVLCDELNTAASLETLLNRLLMSTGPNGEEQSTPGFMLVGTQNPTTMAGRARTSAALLHRMHYRVLPEYTKVEMHLILREMGLPNRRADALVQQYLSAKDNNEALCFRDVIIRAENGVKALLEKAAKQITGDDLLACARSQQSHAEVLEAVFYHKLCDCAIKRELVQNVQADSQLLAQLVENDKNKFIQDIIKFALQHPNTSHDTLIYIERKLANKETCSAILNHPNCNDSVLSSLLESAAGLEMIREVMQHPSCSAATLISILDKCHDDVMLHAALIHPGCNSEVLLKIVALSNDDDIYIAAICHQHTLAAVLALVLEKSAAPDITTLVLINTYCDNHHLAMIVEKTSDMVTWMRVAEHRECCVETLHKLLLKCGSGDGDYIDIILKKIYSKGSSVDMGSTEMISRPFIYPHARKYFSEEDWVTVVNVISDTELLSRIQDDDAENISQLFYRFIATKPQTSVLRKIVEKTSCPRVLGAIVAVTDDQPLLQQISNKTKDVDVLIAVFKKTRDKAPLAAVIEDSATDAVLLMIADRINDVELLNIVAGKTTDLGVLRSIVDKPRDSALLIRVINKAGSSQDRRSLLAHISSDEVFVNVLEKIKDDSVLKTAVCRILHCSRNNELLTQAVNHKQFDHDRAIFYLKNTALTEGVLRAIVSKAAFYPVRTLHSFFSGNYELAPVLAMLKLIKAQYEAHAGAHQDKLNLLIAHASKDEVVGSRSTVDAIWKLVRSGDIGNSGRLRSALKEVFQTVEASRPLEVDKILAYVGPKKNMFGFTSTSPK